MYFTPSIYKEVNYFLRKPMKTINVKGHEVIVDDEDYERFCHLNWTLNNKGYAKLRASKCAYMHHFVLPQKDGMVTDHIDRNRRNNSRSNLRHVTHTENCLNSHRTLQRALPPRIYKRAGFKDSRYAAAFRANGQQHWTKTYRTVEETQAALRALWAIINGDKTLI
jgi:hypothetical protein